MKRELDGLLTPYKVVKTSRYYQLFLKDPRVFQLKGSQNWNVWLNWTRLWLSFVKQNVVIISWAPGLVSGSGGQP